MDNENIMTKLTRDIENRKHTYQKELEKLKEEKSLLSYIKGILEITENDVSNFPYYNEDERAKEDSLEDFNVMLKYTLKEDKIISSFKAEIKNLYYLEQIGYQHALQYKETKKKLEEYRLKIKEAYQELVENETFKQAVIKKEEIIKKLDNLKKELEKPQNKEIINIDKFYEELCYTNLSENEKTTILLFVLEKNLEIEKQKLKELEEVEPSNHNKKEKLICIMTKDEINTLKKILINNKNIPSELGIKLYYPNNLETPFFINNELKKINNQQQEPFLLIEN